MGFFDRLFQTVPPAPTDYTDVVQRTAGMTGSSVARALARVRGLSLVDVAWEDPARFEGSCVGPHISDLTIQVHHEGETTCMPVLRFPNFSDRTGDVSLDAVGVPVGNEKEGGSVCRVPLRDYLSDLRRHLSAPGSWPGPTTSLLEDDEKDVLVSAQACFLPVPKEGEARFNPVLFNYQSQPGAPAVLAILVTRQGTSATIIDNQRDAFASGGRWGQRLFHNAAGERASLTGTRATDFVAQGGDAFDAPTTAEEAVGLNRVMLIQVPLKQPDGTRVHWGTLLMAGAAPAPAMRCRSGATAWFSKSDVEEAVIGHGELEGPFTEIAGQAIERDPRFPIRVTVQFYQATSNGVVSAADMKRLAGCIDGVYADAHASGSLVFADEGRSTAWDDEGKGKAMPSDWFEGFWARREAATGRSRAQLLAELEALLGGPVDPDAVQRLL